MGFSPSCPWCYVPLGGHHPPGGLQEVGHTSQGQTSYERSSQNLSPACRGPGSRQQ